MVAILPCDGPTCRSALALLPSIGLSRPEQKRQKDSEEMLEREAHWVGEILDRLQPDRISPLLNVGSATASFREQVQPWIDQRVFAPLRNRGVVIHHLDIQHGDGVTLCGDLIDDAFVAGLSGRGYRALLCCNLLEHVPDPRTICSKLEGLLPAGGYLVVTVPHRFPYHPDPIDTGFRPTVAELVRLFPRCNFVEGVLLDCGTGWHYVGRDPRALLAKVIQRLIGMRQHGGVAGTASFGPWLFRRFHQTCVVLQKPL